MPTRPLCRTGRLRSNRDRNYLTRPVNSTESTSLFLTVQLWRRIHLVQPKKKYFAGLLSDLRLVNRNSYEDRGLLVQGPKSKVQSLLRSIDYLSLELPFGLRLFFLFRTCYRTLDFQLWTLD